MSSGDFYHRNSDGYLSRKNHEYSTIEFPFSKTIPFANEFLDGMDEWDKSMNWEGLSAEKLPSSGRESSLHSSISRDYQWLRYTNTKLDTFDQIAIRDAPYELDNSLTMPDFYLELCSPDIPLMLVKRRFYYGYSSLSIEEERALQEIAMPYRKESIVSTTIKEERESSCSPEPEERNRGKKRKSATRGAAVDTEDLSQSRKRGHNAIEKRYRTNLNKKYDLLRQSIPSLRVLSDGKALDEDDYDKSGEVATKYGKAVILTRGVEYITHLKHCTERMRREAIALKARVAAFEKLALSGSI